MTAHRDSTRLNVHASLPEHAAKLSRLAEQAYTLEGTLARSLLSRAIDDADLDSRSMVDLLERHPGGPRACPTRPRAGPHRATPIPLDDL